MLVMISHFWLVGAECLLLLSRVERGKNKLVYYGVEENCSSLLRSFMKLAGWTRLTVIAKGRRGGLK